VDYAAIAQDIRVLTPQTAVIAAAEPQWAYLATGRRSAESPKGACCRTEAQLISAYNYLTDARVAYVLLKTTPRNQVGFYGLNFWDTEDEPAFRSWVMGDQSRFVRVAQRGVFSLYAIQH
jgi:hypothetical protein